MRMELATIKSLVRKNVLNLKPYSSARDEFKGTASVYLDANENPYPSEFNRYPDPHQAKLKARISEIKKIDSAKIFIGNGSDEPIDLLIRAFCEPGQDEILIPQPTYGMYQVSADINNVAVNSVSLTRDFDLDVAAMKRAWSEKTKLLFLCTPNNPSGNRFTEEKMIDLIETFPGIVVIDEAYIDFVDGTSFTTKLSSNNNLVVLQTLSKAWGMASLRIGLCFANEFIISILNKIKPPYNLSGITQSIALERLNHENEKQRQVEEIKAQRKELSQKLSNLEGIVKVFPSDANFLLVKMQNAPAAYQQLLNKGVIVRDRSKVVLCDQCLRITVGTPKENQELVNELSNL